MLDLSRLLTRLVPSREAGPLRAHTEVAVARRLFSDASELGSRSDGVVSALLLYREGFRRLATARAIQSAPEETPVDAKGVSHADAVKSLFNKAEDANALFDLDPLVIESRTQSRNKDLKALLRASRKAAARLETFLRNELGWTRRELRWARIALFLGAAAALATLVAHEARGPRNVALGKPVTASSTRFGTPTALTNGAIEWGTFGLHTYDGDAWALIDLGEFYSLARATIFGRGDSHFTSNLPLQIELSDDGTKFRPGASCTEPMFQAMPCRASLRNERARYVRVHASGIVLTEVEVFGVR